MLVQVQNIYVSQRDQLKDQLTDLCKIRPRTYKDIGELEENIATTIKCIERGYSNKEGEEESDAMRSFIRNNLPS